jgi:Flp pilus assembly protein TadD
MKAAGAYLTDPEDVTAVADYLEEIETEESDEESSSSEAFENLYDMLLTLAGPAISESYYSEGYEAYRQEDYENAIPYLEKAVKYDAANGDALYNLANSYYRAGQEDLAREAYLQVIDLFPGTEKANRSEGYVAEIENEE